VQTAAQYQRLERREDPFLQPLRGSPSRTLALPAGTKVIAPPGPEQYPHV
jgi:hypothetical protein